MPFTGPVEDRNLIRERVSAYADSMFSQDLDAWLAHFTEDVDWRFGTSTMKGKDELRASWPNLWNPLKAMGYFTEVGSIEVDGNRARAKCYSRQIMFRKDGSVAKMVGLYKDELIKQDGQWLFAAREFVMIGQEPGVPAEPPAGD